VTDPIAEAVEFLAKHLEYARHSPWVDEMVRDLAECAAVMRGLAAGPRERVYLGPCGAPVPQPAEGVPDLPCCVATTCEPHGSPCCHHGDPVECPADPYVGDVPCETPLYGRLGASKATCRTCGAEHVPDQCIQERVELAGQYTYTAAEIADAYPALRANTITKWYGRGLLVNHGTEGRPLYDVAEVLQVAETADLQERRKIRQRVALGAGTGA
jgi:hypothetical protein